MMRESTFLTCGICIAVILLHGCVQDRGEADTSEDVAVIKAVSEQMVAAYKDRDWDASAGFFTENGIWMPPGVAPLQGKDAWWAWVEPWWGDSTVVEMDVSSEEIVVAGD
jgi:ketosteroid isomerase-like protein